MKDLIKRLTETYGPSGNEEPIREQIKKEIRGLGGEVKTDVLGNLIALKRGKGRGLKIMVAAHMDEIGFIVTHIDKQGFVRVSNIGGIYLHNVIAQRVIFAKDLADVIRFDAACFGAPRVLGKGLSRGLFPHRNAARRQQKRRAALASSKTTAHNGMWCPVLAAIHWSRYGAPGEQQHLPEWSSPRQQGTAPRRLEQALTEGDDACAT